MSAADKDVDSRISSLQDLAFTTARDKGWWPEGALDDTRFFAEKLLLIVTEVAEAFEDIRANRKPADVFYMKRVKMTLTNPVTGAAEEKTVEFEVPKGTPGGKPCGVLSELADVVIRLFDLCGGYGLDLQGMVLEKMSFNGTREFRHGGKAC